MGKTGTVLLALDSFYDLVGPTKTLIIAPLLVAGTTWLDELDEWGFNMTISVVAGLKNERERIRALEKDADIYTINFEMIPWLIDYYSTRAWPFKIVISDEASKLKGFRLRQGAARPRELAKVAHRYVEIFWELTGTPAPNGYIDLWGQLWFLDAGKRLGKTFTAFKDRWFITNKYTNDIKLIDDIAQEEIHSRIEDICLTIKSEDWFDLKEPIVNNIYINLPAGARAQYDQMQKELFTLIDNHEIEAVNAAVRTQKLLQFANGAVYIDPSVDCDSDKNSREFKSVHEAKLDALQEIVDEASGAPILVSYYFRSDLQRLLKRFKKARHLDKNPETLKDWSKGKIPILLAHPKSAGHGLSLQHGGNILVYFSHDWNLEERLQIAERIGPTRQAQSGYDRNVFIYNIVARDTIDDIVIARTDKKESVMSALLSAMNKLKR